MKFFILLAGLFCSTSIRSAAQDSTVIYYRGDGTATLFKDSSSQTMVFTRDGKLWLGRSYYTRTGIRHSAGSYSKADLHRPYGTVDYYDTTGVLLSSYEYDREANVKSWTNYYPSGKKHSYLEYGKKGATKQIGWDEDGNVIPGYIVQQEAQFPGGLQAWKKYLESTLDHSIPEKLGLAPGRYTVVVSFRIDKDGRISEVKAENIPGRCAACAAEAVRVISEGPDWLPAVQNNKNVIFRQRQSITFVLEEDKPKTGNGLADF
ncbi:MAG TPA: energy transducer TonB [Chitinophagaceae bacterium]